MSVSIAASVARRVSTHHHPQPPGVRIRCLPRPPQASVRTTLRLNSRLKPRPHTSHGYTWSAVPNRGRRVARGHNRRGNAPPVALLPQLAEDGAEVRLGPPIDNVGGGRARGRRVHAHVQGAVAEEGKTPVGGVELHGAHPVVEE